MCSHLLSLKYHKTYKKSCIIKIIKKGAKMRIFDGYFEIKRLEKRIETLEAQIKGLKDEKTKR